MNRSETVVGKPSLEAPNGRAKANLLGPVESGGILVDTRWCGVHGIGRFATEVVSRLQNVRRMNAVVPLLHPLDPIITMWQISLVKPDVFFSPGFNPPIYSRYPCVFTIHDLIHLKINEESSVTKRAYYELVVKKAAKRAAKVLTVSEFSKSEIVTWARIPEENVVVVGNGVSSLFSEEGVRYSPGYPYLFYLGNHKPHKNMARLLKAFSISTASKDIKLVMSGRPDRQTVSVIRQHSLEDKVVFAGVIPEEDLPAYLRGAVALLFPSLYEGFGLPAVEAMACGTPVIASNRTSLPEVVGEAGLLVNPYDVENMASAIDTIATDSTQRSDLRKKGIRRTKCFDWNKVAEKVIRVLDDVAAGTRGLGAQ